VKANPISDMLEILALVTIIIAVIIVFGVLLFQFADGVEQWLKRRRDQGQKEEWKRSDHDPDAP
jgi:hypothetical protein